MQQGTVKRFDAVKGYGFIVGDDGQEVFVHHSEVLMKGFRLLEAGQRVSYKVESVEKGNKAINVILK